MDEKKIHSSLKIRKRPWYAWLLWFIWLFWIIFWAEVSIGSWKEAEPRALAIAVVVLAASLLGGILLWLKGYFKSKKREN